GGFVVSDAAGIGRSMNAIMRFRKAHPHHASRISRSRRQLRRSLLGTRIPEMDRIVVEPRITLHAYDRPMADRQRVVGSTHGGRVLREQRTSRAVNGHGAPGF